MALFVLISYKPAHGFCWEEASERYNVPIPLLKAIAEVESDFDPYAKEILKETESVGLMQINSFWLEILKTYGITQKQLYEPCININIGAWILSMEIERYGLTWQAVGAYNAGAYTNNNKERKLVLYRRYAEKVLGRLGKYM